MQRMLVVSPELRVRAFERRVAVRLGLFDTIPAYTCQSRYSLLFRLYRTLVVLCAPPWVGEARWEVCGRRTRSCAPSSTDYAETSSWILRGVSWYYRLWARSYVLAIATVLLSECAELCRLSSSLKWNSQVRRLHNLSLASLMEPQAARIEAATPSKSNIIIKYTDTVPT